VTHYETLKVTQDAPIEVIAAAYKALARLYHPDKNSTTEAIVIMQNINMAYKVLSDPLKRSEHDLWIKTHERRVDPPPITSGQRRASAVPSADLKVKADKAATEATKWTGWADKVALDAKEAQARADKAVVDLTRAKPADRAKWEVWVAKTAQEAKEAKEKADKANAQAAKAVADALEAAAQVQSKKTGD
jgi:hypothetical protein